MMRIPPKLYNNGNVCYANSVIQSLMVLDSFDDKLSISISEANIFSDPNLFVFLADFYYDKVYSVNAIRLYLVDKGYSFRNFDGQQDAYHFTGSIINEFKLVNNFKVVYKTKFSCYCGYKWESKEIVSIHLSIIPKTSATLNKMVKNIVKEDDVNCPLCDLLDKDDEYYYNSVRSSIDILSTSEYLILMIQRYQNPPIKDLTPIEDFDEDNIKIGKDVFRVVSCIEHFGEDLNRGHYISHVRTITWWKCNDTSVNIVKSLPKGLSNVYLLYLEKKH